MGTASFPRNFSAAPRFNRTFPQHPRANVVSYKTCFVLFVESHSRSLALSPPILISALAPPARA